MGHSGEEAAVRALRKSGLTILERNYRCRYGEIDVVARDGITLVFCEVKARATDRWGDPSEAVDHRKQGRLRRLAAEWLSSHPVGTVEIRFDVVSVIVRDGRTELRHIVDAF
jgi:putative endonuclease